MPRFQCVFPNGNANANGTSCAQGRQNGQKCNERPRIEAVYEFEAPDVEQLYRWLEKQGAPIRSIRDIVPVKNEPAS